MKVNVIIQNPPKTGSFAAVQLSFEDPSGNIRYVDLHIPFQSLKDFSNDTSSVAFDFFLVSSLIYGIDNLLERYQFSIDGWARDIEVSLPVNNLQVWNDNAGLFNKLLSFLTGDYWDVSFEQVGDIEFYTDKAKRWKSKIRSYNPDDYTFASLFSGGLDSLVGVIDGLNNLTENKKGLLLSHFDSSSPGANSDQENIINFFSRNTKLKDKYDWIQCVVALDNHDSRGNELTKEASFRSRSLLFIGIALFCVERLPSCNVLTIPENGTISINYPLTLSRTSTLSTRTTHPHYISQLQTLLKELGLSTNLDNPYKSLTKGQLVQQCLNKDQLNGTYSLSVSCGKRGRKMHWDTKLGTNHCGICMPCIYRRAALHKLNMDNQLYGIDIFSTPNQIFDKYDFPALFDFLKSDLTRKQIKRTLLVSGSIPFDEIEESASLVEQIREEVKQWIKDKGSDNFKKMVGIE
ncbi:MAG: Qat anti-phage system QueC-like protein QatC [Mangrovibacterium sp.]